LIYFRAVLICSVESKVKAPRVSLTLSFVLTIQNIWELCSLPLENERPNYALSLMALPGNRLRIATSEKTSRHLPIGNWPLFKRRIRDTFQISYNGYGTEKLRKLVRFYSTRSSISLLLSFCRGAEPTDTKNTAQPPDLRPFFSAA
jgi:hypothetical protein